MSINFPTSLDSLTNNTDNVDTIVAQDINDLNDAVEALETKVGIDNSADSTSLDYKIKNSTWPIGSVFLSVVSTDPNTLLGFGTWSQIAGGKVLIGQTSGDADFNVAEETGGAKTADLSHTHTGPSHTHTGPSHTHSYSGTTSSVSATGGGGDGSSNTRAHSHTYSGTTGADGTGNTGAGGTGNTGSAGSATQSIMNPYFVVYCWKRTA